MVATGLRLVAEGKLMPPAGWRDNYTTEQRRAMAGMKPRLQSQLYEPKRRANLSAALQGHKPTRTGPHSPESLIKMSAAQKGKPRSPEYIANMREAQLGKKLSPETKAKLSAAGMGNQRLLGHKHSPETRAKMSASQRGKKHKKKQP